MQNEILDGTHPENIDLEFVCHYSDGTKLLQNYNSENEKHFGHIEQDRLEIFELAGSGKSYKLNLKTGEFDLNGFKCQFKLRDIPQENYKRELVYFRRVRNDFTPEGTVTTIRFGLGWRTSIDGQTHIRIVLIERDGSCTLMMNK